MEPTPFAVGKLLSGLVDRPVQMTRADNPSFSPNVLFATYDVEPFRHVAIVKIDFAMLASLAGIMIGIPARQVELQVAKGTMDDDLTDSSREMMNVLSSVVVVEDRAIFKKIVHKEAELSPDERTLLTRGWTSKVSLKCTVSAQPAGFMTIVRS